MNTGTPDWQRAEAIANDCVRVLDSYMQGKTMVFQRIADPPDGGKLEEDPALPISSTVVGDILLLGEFSLDPGAKAGAVDEELSMLRPEIALEVTRFCHRALMLTKLDEFPALVDKYREQKEKTGLLTLHAAIRRYYVMLQLFTLLMDKHGNMSEATPEE